MGKRNLSVRAVQIYVSLTKIKDDDKMFLMKGEVKVYAKYIHWEG